MLEYYVGLMSGTSLDGVDAALVAFDKAGRLAHTGTAAHLPFPAELRQAVFELQHPRANELHEEALAGQMLARVYAEAVEDVLRQNTLPAAAVRAIGAHGQTIRHRPEFGYTWQTLDAALLAEITGIDVIADFRSRDIAAGGQGAPLVPAFHAGVFGLPGQTRVVLNLGGIANISVLRADGFTFGFDTGPANMLMDAWMQQCWGVDFDDGGSFARSGCIVDALLQVMLAEPFFAASPPKSTGRDVFHADWLADKLRGFEQCSLADVMATLAELTARTVAQEVSRYAPEAAEVLVCGGGAYNSHLMDRLEVNFLMLGVRCPVESTRKAGVPPNQVEAMAFAWLARQFTHRQPGNLPAVTGASGPRVLGALYPA